MSMFSAILADVIVVIHAAFVGFIVGGQFVILVGWSKKWLWPRNSVFRVLHLVAISYVVLEAWLGITCPLTSLEQDLRSLAGEETYSVSFIGYWVHYFLFYTAPNWVFTWLYTLFGSLVLVTVVAYPPLLSKNLTTRS
ncbi:hypothetical protein THII_2809 [Thioploca ingrica]|uniref:DUF2784 domain-containing protein n=1 Tax=Thioploca ingrica TaxID=40754 RepID=A0A090BVM3_9GAMM|nr:hypothetical protein THII_2809 [Thioploca ingrica]